MRSTRSACGSAPPAVRCGGAPTRASRGRASRATCRRSTPSSASLAAPEAVMVRVRIPTPLRSYTGDAKEVEVDGATVDDLLRSLDDRFPGIRFRVVDEQGRLRKHMKVFV